MTAFALACYLGGMADRDLFILEVRQIVWIFSQMLNDQTYKKDTGQYNI